MLIDTYQKPKIKKHKAELIYKPIPEPIKKCRKTGMETNIAKHHVFFGRKHRQLSEQYKLYVWLVPYYHNMSNVGVHFNKKFDDELKREYQMRFEVVNGIGSFAKVFGINYLEVG